MGHSHLSKAKRSRKHYGLMYVDLDRFKSINDTLGHHVGDLLLQTVASRLQSALRESDVVARMGGDEFIVLLNELDSVADIEMVANKVIELISRPCTNLDGHDIQVNPSIGIAVFPQDGHNVETLCQHADAAMYQSKRAGRGRYTFFDPALNPASDRQFSLEQRLSTAIAEGELILHFQPKVRLSDFKIVGLEALVRWQHPEHGLLPRVLGPAVDHVAREVETCRAIPAVVAAGACVVVHRLPFRYRFAPGRDRSVVHRR